MVLQGLSIDEAKALILSVGTHHGHRNLSPVEVARLFRKALSHGTSRKECALFVHLNGPDMVSRFLRLLELHPFVQHSTDWRQTGPTISFTSAWNLSVLENQEQEQACIEIMKNQMKTKEVEQIIQLRQRSRRNFSECMEEVIHMRPSIEKIHVILGAVIQQDVKDWLSEQTQIQRDILFREILAQTYQGTKKVSGRLGVDKFTIVTDQEGFSIVNPRNEGSFESVITQTLKAKMDS